jgi:hypothetical protein
MSVPALILGLVLRQLLRRLLYRRPLSALLMLLRLEVMCPLLAVVMLPVLMCPLPLLQMALILLPLVRMLLYHRALLALLPLPLPLTTLPPLPMHYCKPQSSRFGTCDTRKMNTLCTLDTSFFCFE